MQIACPTLPTYGYVFVRRDFSMLQRNAGSCRSDSLLPVPPSVCTEICPRVRVLPSADCLAPRSSLSTCPRGFFCPDTGHARPCPPGMTSATGSRETANCRCAEPGFFNNEGICDAVSLCNKEGYYCSGGFPPFRKHLRVCPVSSTVARSMLCCACISPEADLRAVTQMLK